MISLLKEASERIFKQKKKAENDINKYDKEKSKNLKKEYVGLNCAFRRLAIILSYIIISEEQNKKLVEEKDNYLK